MRRLVRTWVARLAASVLARAYLRLRLEQRANLPGGPAIYCVNHLSWADPFLMMAILPMRPQLTFFGPREEDMSVGGRNRLLTWTGATIPYRPGKENLLEATRRVHAVIAAGGVLVIFGEGRIHPTPSAIGPLNEGAAYFALRERVPVVPIGIAGTSWLAFGRRIRVVVGEPILPDGRPSRAQVDALTARVAAALGALVAEAPGTARPGPVGRWMSEIFNEWPEGDRASAERHAALAGVTGPPAAEKLEPS